MSTPINLGQEVPDYGNPCCAPIESKPTGTIVVYPELRISGNSALVASVEIGQEFTAVVKFRVTGLEARKGGRHYGPKDDTCYVELEALELTPQMKLKDGDEQSATEALAEFLGKKKEKH